MRIGIDFDNTIVRYDGVFHRAAVEQGLLPADSPATKGQVRDRLREMGLENRWIELQGHVYGPGMAFASEFPGVSEFLARCDREKIPAFIISHRTRHPFAGPHHDLHRAARDWLASNNFHAAAGIAPDNVFFELTKEDKLRRVASAGCTHFIDDLPEFLGEPAFPEGVERILFDPAGNHPGETRFRRVGSWREIADIFFKD